MKRINFGFTAALFILVMIYFTPIHGLSMEKAGKFVAGDIVKFHSQVLGEERMIYVHLPMGYENNNDKYPVLYLLDGGRSFMIGVGVVQFFYNSGLIPEMIVVGIPNTNRIRDLSPTNDKNFPDSGGAERFIQFIQKELIPGIDKNYRTQKFRVLWGHSLAGLLTTHIMLNYPDTFNAYIAVTPWFLWGNKDFLNKSQSLLEKNKQLNKFYYFFVGNEPEIENVIIEFEQKLKSFAPKGLRWKFSRMKEEDHITILEQSLAKGILQLYTGWQVTGELLDKGLDAVKNHYKALSQTYGYPIPVPAEALNQMGFQMLSKEQLIDAAVVFQYCIELYPRYWIAYHNLGYCYQHTGNKEKAIQYYRESLRLNPDNQRAIEHLKELEGDKKNQ